VNDSWIEADWPAPNGVRAVTTLRHKGVSSGVYASFNLAGHVGDNPDSVAENRRRLRESLALPADPVWLRQVHGTRVVRAEAADGAEADASHTRQAGVICAVLTADCLPLVLCDRDGSSLAAVHAGWRGLAAGVIEATIDLMRADAPIAWLGPAIGPAAFQVGNEVRESFLRRAPALDSAFRAQGNEKWLADLYGLARFLLRQSGVRDVYGGSFCTYSEPERFFSYRRDGRTGRMATLIWRV
jgi:YfiH family protein